MDDTPQPPIDSAQHSVLNNPKGMQKHIKIPGTTYFRERRLRPIFFGWLCGFLTLLAATAGTGLIWLTNYVSNYPNGYVDFSVIYYGALMLAVVVLILMFLVTTLGLPILYGHINGMKQIIKIIIHELIFLTVILAVLFMLSVKFSGLFHPPNQYMPNDCPNCAQGL